MYKDEGTMILLIVYSNYIKFQEKENFCVKCKLLILLEFLIAFLKRMMQRK